jgi:hypothetical protein
MRRTGFGLNPGSTLSFNSSVTGICSIFVGGLGFGTAQENLPGHVLALEPVTTPEFSENALPHVMKARLLVASRF